MSTRTTLFRIVMYVLPATTASVLPVTGASLIADEKSDPESAVDKQRGESAARFAVMERRAKSLSVEIRTDRRTATVDLIEPALLRYSNPAGQIVVPDASVWAWGGVGRPLVLASIEDGGCEVVSLSDHPVSLTTRSGAKWSAEGSNIEWHVVTNTPPPGESTVVRALQMKQVARRFTATGHYGPGEENYKLRLLEKPLYRYANRDNGVFDGAVYAFTAGTNPEVILILESRADENHRQVWHYGCTRLSAGSLEAHLDGTTVWTCPAIVQWSETAPYTTVPWGPADPSAESATAK